MNRTITLEVILRQELDLWESEPDLIITALNTTFAHSSYIPFLSSKYIYMSASVYKQERLSSL